MTIARGPWPVLALLLLLAGPMLPGFGAPAAAHGRSTPAGSATGISIPNLTHGQMAVLADHQREILDLAARQFPTDPDMRRLDGFIALQSFTCLWGLVPGSITDENSPYNECSHAALAGARALLLHLRTMPGDRSEVNALVQRIEREMIEQGASLVLCRYSDEPFNTAEVINPSLDGVPLDPVNLGRMLIGGIASAWLAVLLARQARRRPVYRVLSS